MSNYEQNIINFYNYQIERIGDDFLKVQYACLNEEIKEFEEAYNILKTSDFVPSFEEVVNNLEKEYADVSFCVAIISYHLSKEVTPPKRTSGAIEAIAEDNMKKVRMKQAQGGSSAGKLVVEGFDKKAVIKDVDNFVKNILGYDFSAFSVIHPHSYLHRADHLNMVVTTIKQSFNIS